MGLAGSMQRTSMLFFLLSTNDRLHVHSKQPLPVEQIVDFLQR